MIKGIHHIGIAVSNLDEALKTYKSVLGLEPTLVKEVKDQKIRAASFRLGESSIELFEPTDPAGAVHNVGILNLQNPIQDADNIINLGLYHCMALDRLDAYA